MSQLGLNSRFFLPGTAASLGGFGAGRRPPIAPPIDPETEKETLSQLMETGLGGLSYVGKVLDKTFGGRAIRGLLGGKPRELASVVPLSDTLGLTNEEDTVTGRKLLENAGVVGPSDTESSFDAGDAGGLAAEIALDPATYLSFGAGALTKAGKLAKASNALPKFGGAAGLVRGYGVRQADLAAVAARHGIREVDALSHLGLPPTTSVLPTALEQAAHAAGSPIGTRYTLGPGPVANVVENATRATPLAGAFGVGLPFGPRVALATGPVGETLARAVPAAIGAPLRLADRAVEGATGFSPRRATRQLFDTSVMGMYDQRAQDLAEQFIRPTTHALETEARTQGAEFLNRLQPFAAKGADAMGVGQRYARTFAERAGVPNDLMLEAQRHFDPAELHQLATIGATMGPAARATRDAEQALAVATRNFADPGAGYFPRSMTVLPRMEGEGRLQYLGRLARGPATSHTSQIARDRIFRNIAGGTETLNRWSTDPALSGAARTLAPDQIAQQLLNDIIRVPPANSARFRSNPTLAANIAERRARRQAGRLADWLGTLPAEHAAQKVPVFSSDVLADAGGRLLKSARSRGTAEGVYEAVRRHAEPITPANADGLVRVDQFLRGVGLTARDPLNARTADVLAGQALGVTPDAVRGYGLPRELASDLARLGQQWQNPREVRPIVTAWDALSQLFKTSVTAPFPAFHTRNLATGLYNSWRSGAVDPLHPIESARTLKGAYDVVRGHGLARPLPGMPAGANPTEELFKELIGQDAAFTTHAHQSSDLTGRAGETVMKRPNIPVASGNTLLGDAARWLYGFVPDRGKAGRQLNPLNVQGVNSTTDEFIPVRQARILGDRLEQFNRVANYLGLRKQGMNPAAAAADVAKYQLDYGDLTSFERNVMKRLVPFYSFSRRNLPPLLGDIATDPGKLAASAHLTQGARTPFEFIPQYLAEGTSLPIGGAPEGQQRYISSFGLPYEDEAVKTIGSLLRGDVTRAGQQVLGMSQPFVKAPLEGVFGTQLYSGRKLQDLRPSELIGGSGLFDEQTARQLTQVLANTPAARTLTSLDRLSDVRKDPITKGINLLTGLRIQDVESQRQFPLAAKKMLQDLLTGRPGVRVAEDAYVSRRATEEGLVDPTTLELYRLYLNQQKAIREAGKK